MKTKHRYILLSFLIGICFSCSNDISIEKDKYKPLYHFTRDEGWIGEPAGLLYDNGIYHVFYQYNPTENVYGNIHWGHAVSKDLIHWDTLAIALFPDNKGYLCSGSVIADRNNTSKLGNDTQYPFIAFYTYQNSQSDQYIFWAYSLDKGITWEKGDSIILSDINDPISNPHITWNKFSKEWLMTVSSESSVQFYTSKDCIHWQYESTFEDIGTYANRWEGCDFFPIQVDGKEEFKWVLLVNMGNGSPSGTSATRYFVGDFNGSQFQVTQSKELWLDYGKDFYSISTFDIATNDHRLAIGWMNCWEYANLLPTLKWRGNLTIPRELKLTYEDNFYLLSSTPINNIKKYIKEKYYIGETELSETKSFKCKFPYPNSSFIIKLKFNNTDNLAIWKSRDYGIRLKTDMNEILTLGYQNELSSYYIDRTSLKGNPDEVGFQQLMGANYRSNSTISDWWIFFDRNSIELFASQGKVSMTSLCYPKGKFITLEIFAKEGTVKLIDATIEKLDDTIIY